MNFIYILIPCAALDAVLTCPIHSHHWGGALPGTPGFLPGFLCRVLAYLAFALHIAGKASGEKTFEERKGKKWKTGG